MTWETKMPKAHTLVDNFNDNSTDTTKWIAYGNPAPLAERVREVNGRVEIRPASGTSGYTGYVSVATYDLTESRISVELIAPLSTRDPSANTFLVAKLDASNTVSIGVKEGYLYAGTQVAGAYSYYGERPYDPALHRWLRIREADSTTFWEVSADATNWTLLTSRTDPFSLSAVRVEFTVGMFNALASPGVAIFDNFNVEETTRSRRTDERRLSARDVRVEAAQLAAGRAHPEHFNNNDEVNYPTIIGNYSKSLPHDSLGDPDPVAYASLLRALQSEDPQDFEEIRLASTTALKLTNPQAGLAFDVEGPDAQEMTQPPAPRFDSEVTAHEMGELYWMAIARDVPFINYGANAVIGAAVASLNNEFPRFGGTVPVTTQNVFRGIFAGEQTGPYVSQFLVKGNADSRKPAGQGRHAADGFISYGSRTIDQRIVPAVANLDYLTVGADWLAVQNGTDKRGTDTFDTVKRFIFNLRAGATFVHFDQVIDAFYNAAWILMSEPTGNQLALPVGRPQVDGEFPKNAGNPYDPPGMTMDSRTQAGFATFGPIHLLQVLGDVLGRSLRAVWWQKWGVHRRLRPEEFGGRVDNWIAARRDYPIHVSIKNSLTGGALAPYIGQPGEHFPNSYLLPQAYPEGAPTHPAYGAGHATGSAALATMLKAFFDDTAPIENPLQPAADGLSLVAYNGADAAQMMVGSELNKLAGNISLFRGAAGVHWRSDYTESVLLGERVAIAMLQEMSLGFNEDDAFFELGRLDGSRIRIRDGVVQVVA
jgi:hypothetical protein